MFGLNSKSRTHEAVGEEDVDALLPALVIAARKHGLLLTEAQLINDNLLASDRIPVSKFLFVVEKAGLRARAIDMRVEDLGDLKKVLPAIVTLKSGLAMVLTEVGHFPDSGRVVLIDPKDELAPKIVLDAARFAEAWTGQIILFKRKYDLTDENQPFSWWFIIGLMLRERRMIRDVAISAVILSLFALSPFIFWSVLSTKVVLYSAYNTFYVACALFLMYIVFDTIFLFLRSFLLTVIVARVDARMNEYLFDVLLKLPIDYFERTPVGQTAHDMNEIYRVREFLTGQVFGTVLDSLVLFVFFPVMAYWSLSMTLVVVAFAALIVLWLLVMLPPLRRASGKLINAQTERGSALYQTLAGMRTVKSLALENRQRAQWDVKSAAVARSFLEVGQLSATIRTIVHPLERMAVSGAYAFGVYQVLVFHDAASTSALFGFLMLAQRVLGPFMQMAQLINTSDEARVAVELLRNLTSIQREETTGANGVRSEVKGHVVFEKLRFKYSGSQNYALEDLSFEVPIGCTLGVVGRSGSGKTTVTRLLQRLHSEYEGSIKIDGVDLREYDLQHLRRSLGVVLQENFLFSGTIRENICAAKPHATYDEVVKACRMAGAEEFIERLPRGYETYIFEGSPNLSGGQRQRLAIARALILDPRILILDEATSALDPDSEAIVNENIHRIASGRTVIVISHRLSSLVDSDAILVLERGKFEAMGTHEQLLESCEIYRGLWNQQNRHNPHTPKAFVRGPARVS